MNKEQRAKFDSLYEKYVRALKRQGKSAKTIETYSRAVRRIAEIKGSESLICRIED